MKQIKHKQKMENKPESVDIISKFVDFCEEFDILEILDHFINFHGKTTAPRDVNLVFECFNDKMKIIQDKEKEVNDESKEEQRKRVSETLAKTFVFYVTTLEKFLKRGLGTEASLIEFNEKATDVMEKVMNTLGLN